MTRRCLFFACIVTALFAVGSRRSRGAEPFTPPPIESFDGSSWAGATLLKTTQGELKKMFKTGRGVGPNSTELSQPKNAPSKVYALFTGKRKEDTLACFLVVYAASADWKPVETSLGGPGVVRYASGRTDDWRAEAYPTRGIVAQLLTQGGESRVAAALLTTPAQAEALANGLSKHPTEISAQKPRTAADDVAGFGTVTVNFSSKGVGFDEQKERETLETMIKQRSPKSPLQFSPSSAGTYKLDISTEGNTKTGYSISITCDIAATTTEGELSGNHFTTIRVPGLDSAKTSLDAGGIGYSIQVLSAMKTAEGQIQKELKSRKPPTPEQARLDWIVSRAFSFAGK